MPTTQKQPANYSCTSGVAQPFPTVEADRRFSAIDRTPTGHKTVFVYGPQGCGKTKNKAAMARHFGLSRIVDDWDGRQRVPIIDALVLTSQPLDPHIRRQLTFSAAMQLLIAPPKYPF